MCRHVLKECPGLTILNIGSTGPRHSASGPEVVTCTLWVLNSRLAAGSRTLFLSEFHSFVSHMAHKCLGKKRVRHSRGSLNNMVLILVQ